MSTTTTTTTTTTSIKLVGKMSHCVQLTSTKTIEEYQLDLKISPVWLDQGSRIMSSDILVEKIFGNCQFSSGTLSNQNGRTGLVVIPDLHRNEIARETRLFLQVLLPGGPIENKTFQIKYVDVDFLNQDDQIVSPHWLRTRQKVHEISHNTFRTSVDCSAGRNPGDPDVDKIRLTLYVELDQVVNNAPSLGPVSVPSVPDSFQCQSDESMSSFQRETETEERKLKWKMYGCCISIAVFIIIILFAIFGSQFMGL